MATVSTVTVITGEGADPFTLNKYTTARAKVRAFRALLKALATGAILSRGTTRPTIRYGTAQASATVTAATVVNANTVTINGILLTATQHNAKSTVTPTVSGIDLNDTVTINGSVFTAKQHYATATVTCAAADAADNVVINGVTFVGTAGAVVLGEATYSIDTGNTEAATSLAAQVNAYVALQTVVTATSSSAVVTLRAVTPGTAGNAITLTSTDGTDLAVTGSGFLANATAVAANEFDFSGTNTQCAVSLAAAINASPDPLIRGVVTAHTRAAVTHIRAVATGTGGNSIALTSSDAQLAVSAATLENGAALANAQFDFSGSDTETATALAAAINAHTTAGIPGVVYATSAAAVVTVKAAAKGRIGNAITLASSGSTVGVSASRLAGGTDTLATL